MAVSKVVLGDETLVDLTSDTVSENTLLEGATAHAANGEQITGGVVVTPMYTGTKAAIEEAIALGQIPEDAVVNITDDEETSSFQTQIDEINNSLTKVKTYVGEDGKLHFIDSAGADSVLPFSGGWEEAKVVTLTSDLTIDIGRKPKELFVGWSASNVTTSVFNLYSYYNEDFSEYTFGSGVSNSIYVVLTDTGFNIKCKYSGRPVFYAYK